MNQVENKNNNNNNSSNSLVFGRWPQTKMDLLKSTSGQSSGHVIITQQQQKLNLGKPSFRVLLESWGFKRAYVGRFFFVALACHELVLDGFDQLLSFLHCPLSKQCAVD